MASKPPRKTSDDEYTVACPGEDCQSTRIRPRPNTNDWRCCECGETFDEPDYREWKESATGTLGPAASLTGASRTLWDADPSEYP